MKGRITVSLAASVPCEKGGLQVFQGAGVLVFDGPAQVPLHELGCDGSLRLPTRVSFHWAHTDGQFYTYHIDQVEAPRQQCTG